MSSRGPNSSTPTSCTAPTTAAPLPDDHAADLLAALAASPTVRDHIAALAVRDAATDRAPAATTALTGLAG